MCRSWLASARHPRFGRPYSELVYQPMLELLGLLDRSGFSCWIFSGGGTDFMRTWASDVYGLPPHRVIGSVGETEFRIGAGRPELVKGDSVQVINDGPQKPSSIHRHVGQRPIVAAGNTDGDLAMLQWAAAGPGRSLQLVVDHTDARSGVRLRARSDPGQRHGRGSRGRRRPEVDRDRHGRGLVSCPPASRLVMPGRAPGRDAWPNHPAGGMPGDLRAAK